MNNQGQANRMLISNSLMIKDSNFQVDPPKNFYSRPENKFFGTKLQLYIKYK